MPTYRYLNTQTEEVSDIFMSISEMETFQKDNPHMERVYDSMNIVDPVSIGAKKPPVDFQKHVLGRVKAMPGADKNKIEKRWTIPKEV